MASQAIRSRAAAGAAGHQAKQADEQEPGTAAGQSQGGGKCAHRPRGASQPPKPTTGGASTSFPVACPPPSRPPARPLALDASDDRLISRSTFLVKKKRKRKHHETPAFSSNDLPTTILFFLFSLFFLLRANEASLTAALGNAQTHTHAHTHARTTSTILVFFRHVRLRRTTPPRFSRFRAPPFTDAFLPPAGRPPPPPPLQLRDAPVHPSLTPSLRAASIEIRAARSAIAQSPVRG